MSDFHTLEVVDRGSETQLQVSENLLKISFFSVLILPLCNYINIPYATNLRRVFFRSEKK